MWNNSVQVIEFVSFSTKGKHFQFRLYIYVQFWLRTEITCWRVKILGGPYFMHCFGLEEGRNIFNSCIGTCNLIKTYGTLKDVSSCPRTFDLKFRKLFILNSIYSQWSIIHLVKHLFFLSPSWFLRVKMKFINIPS